MTKAMSTINETLAATSFSDALISDFCEWVRGTASARTLEAYRKNLSLFFGWLDLNGITNPSRADVLNYKADLQARGLKANTINSYLSAIRCFFEWAASAGIYANISVHISNIKIDKTQHKREALTAQQAAAVEQSITETGAAKIEAAQTADKDRAGRIERASEQAARDAAMYALAVNAGLRTIEIARANVGDFTRQQDGGAWLYVQGKGRQEADQKKYLVPEIADLICAYLETRTDSKAADSPLFVATGNRSKGQRIASTTISTILKHSLQAAGIDSPAITAHSLRHTCGTTAQESTGNIYATQKFLRHASPETTEIYLHGDDDKQERETAAAVYAALHGGKKNITKADSARQVVELLQRIDLDSLAALIA